MTLYGFPDPRPEILAYLKAEVPNYSAGVGATVSTSYPANLSGEERHVQFAWDGTPSEDEVREVTAIRVTCWTAAGQVSDGIALAALVRALLLDFAGSDIWRVLPGAGRTPGQDPDSLLQFVTFTVNAETRPSAVV